MDKNKGLIRIYIVISCVWFLYFFEYIGIDLSSCQDSIILGYRENGTFGEIKSGPISTFITCNPLRNFLSFLPIPLYFAIKWIIDGFKK